MLILQIVHIIVFFMQYEFSDFIGSAFEIRNDSDYEDFYIVSKDECKQQFENARTFFKAMENYINTL